MAAYLELVAATVPTRQAAALTGVARASAYRKQNPKPVVERDRVEPVNKLSEAETARLLATLNDDRFVDLAPLQVYARLLDEGIYLCSVSTMYRTLAAHDQVSERRRLARHPARARPELVATGPGQVYMWDITKLAGPVTGRYYDAYMMIDIYSRHIVGVQVRDRESGPLAVEMMKQMFGIYGIPQVVHADSKTVLARVFPGGLTRKAIDRAGGYRGAGGVLAAS